MKIPDPTLMRLYGTADVFFKKASAKPRLADVLFEKLALPMAMGMKPRAPMMGLKAPTTATQASSVAQAPLVKKPVPSALGPGFGPTDSSWKADPMVARGLQGPELAQARLDKQNVKAKLDARQSTPPAQSGARPIAGAGRWQSGPGAGAAPLPSRVQAISSAAGQGTPLQGPGTLGGGRAATGVLGKAKPGPVQGAPLGPGQLAGGGPAPGAPTINPTATTEGAPEGAAKSGKGGTPWNKILAVGGALGAGALGLGALNSGLKFLGGHGAAPPADYGYAPGGYQVPMGVNGYGGPQPGSRMM